MLKSLDEILMGFVVRQAHDERNPFSRMASSVHILSLSKMNGSKEFQAI
jgi:hypothetical protein